MITVESCQEAGLSDQEIQLLHAPFSQMNPGQRHAAFAALDKFDAHNRGDQKK